MTVKGIGFGPVSHRDMRLKGMENKGIAAGLASSFPLLTSFAG